MMDENLPPLVVKRVAKELRNLARSPIAGIKLNVNSEVLTDINAEIKGPVNTPYETGVFKVKLVLSKSFPSQPPKGFFITPIFHPNVGPGGEICVNTLGRDWSPDDGLGRILVVIRCLLIVPNPDSALNEEAGMLLQENYNQFYQRAQLFTQIHACRKSACLEDISENNENLMNSNSSSPRKIKSVAHSSKKKKRNKKKKKSSKSLLRL